ncbi:MAG: TonB family protein [Candidatus Dadabacteria bacterium]|nr:TonB family protein [Candidatus Dadabacteria bacterium]NIQ14063.1 TonB family protein [Candidatus Dadabacteria bacterium]
MTRRKNNSSSTGIIVSIIFHIALIAALIYLSANKKKDIIPVEKSIEVSLATGSGRSESSSLNNFSKAETKEKTKKEEIKEEIEEEKVVPEKEIPKKEDIEETKIVEEEIKKEVKEVVKKKEELKKAVPIKKKKVEKKKVEKKKKKVAKKKEKPKKVVKKKKEVVKKDDNAREGVLKELKKKAILKGLKSEDKGTKVANAEGDGTGGLETTGSGGGTSVNPVVLRIYYETISDRIESNLESLPNIEPELVGVLESEVSFYMYESGGAYNVAIYSSSGNEIFDKSCVAAVRSASPFPDPPKELISKIKKEPFVVPCDNKGQTF